MGKIFKDKKVEIEEIDMTKETEEFIEKSRKLLEKLAKN